MSDTSVQLNQACRNLLAELTAKTGESAANVLEKALDNYRRKVFFDQLNSGYAALRADPKAWAEELAERKAWDATLMDGLDPSDPKWNALRLHLSSILYPPPTLARVTQRKSLFSTQNGMRCARMYVRTGCVAKPYGRKTHGVSKCEVC